MKTTTKTEELLPQDLEAEAIVLSAMMLWGRKDSPVDWPNIGWSPDEIRQTLSPDVFMGADYRMIWEAVVDTIDDKGSPVSSRSVIARLQGRQKPFKGEGSWRDRVKTLLDAFVVPEEVPEHVEALADLHAKRQAYSELTTLRERLCDPLAKRIDLADATEHTAVALRNGYRRRKGLSTTRLCDIVEATFEYYCSGRIPLGELSLFGGLGDVGKGCVYCDMVARQSVGRPWPHERDKPVEPSGTLLVSSEDSYEKTVVPRLRIAGADLSRIERVNGVPPIGRPGQPELFSMLEHAPDLEEHLIRNPDIKCVVIDPLASYYGKVDSHRDPDLRRALMPIVDVAHRRNVAVIGVCHFTKANAPGTAAHARWMGSAAVRNAARTAWMVSLDPFDMAPIRERRRLFVPDKFNIGPRPNGLGFWIEPDRAEPDYPKVRWGDEAITMTSDELNAALRRQAAPKSGPARREAIKFLRTVLAKGPVPATVLQKEAKEAGISKNTLIRAKDDLGVTVDKEKTQWVWRLPDKEDTQ